MIRLQRFGWRNQSDQFWLMKIYENLIGAFWMSWIGVGLLLVGDQNMSSWYPSVWWHLWEYRQPCAAFWQFSNQSDKVQLNTKGLPCTLGVIFGGVILSWSLPETPLESVELRPPDSERLRSALLLYAIHDTLGTSNVVRFTPFDSAWFLTFSKRIRLAEGEKNGFFRPFRADF